MGSSDGEIRFDGRVAIVTGSGGGLGRAYATELARRGAKVVVNDIGGDPLGNNPSAGPAAETAARLRELGGEAIANTDTVATPAGGAAIVQTALDTWGRVDVIVNNAGVVPNGQSIADAPKDEWDRVLDVHLGGAINVLRGRLAGDGGGRLRAGRQHQLQLGLRHADGARLRNGQVGARGADQDRRRRGRRPRHQGQRARCRRRSRG